jgi:hypothetical protein
MLRAPAFFLFALLLQQRQCSMVSPDAIEGQVEQALRPYFSNARGRAIPQTQAIFAYTCTQGVTPEFVAKIAAYIGGDRDINQKLNMVQFAPLLGGAHYRYFLLGFDGGWVRYDLDAHKISVETMRPLALEAYKKACGF